MKAQRIVKILMIFFLCLGISMSIGCASIVSKSEYPVTINSNPPGATVTVKNKRGIELQKTITPATITLSAKTGYFSPANYSFQFEKEGYFPGSASLSAGMDGWYIGNILFGGLIGILIVDPATGAMWKLDDIVCGNLAPDPSYKVAAARDVVPATTLPLGPETDQSISVQLKKLKDLKESGLLKEDEYETKRKALVEKL